ncbi:hypothetical protein GCM10009865_51010 [Aeromicrobium ponti]|uniref:Uncharacterized protein n=1 Tax=Cytobacillus oceanisediminis TaxID=665099 RepID=A0A562J7I4_9BACI|nr:hypothetical protein IQ19_05038 [Cytobacillus oceanisediminis]
METLYKKGVRHLLVGLAYDLEPMVPGAKQLSKSNFINFFIFKEVGGNVEGHG